MPPHLKDIEMNNINLNAIFSEAEERLISLFAEIDKTARINTKKILDIFKEERVSDTMFSGTSGYGYDDIGRDTLDRIFAKALGCESAFVRHSIASGTHALTIGLFGLLRTGDTMLAITGKPYDTLDEVIGISGEAGRGSLADYGIKYSQIDLLPSGEANIEEIKSRLAANPDIKVAFIQRSKGYLNRPTLTVAQINELADIVHQNSNAYVVVDNCYGEFTEECEPSHADLLIGSLIKNPGGGMAECGAYLAGSTKAVELCGYRFTAVGVGLEIGATLGNNKSLYKGLFFAPHTVAQAIKTAHLAAYIFEKLGFETEPKWNERRSDIIQSVICNDRDIMIALCRGIQYGSPVDAFVSCEPWAMPGYSDEIIMAAGAFTQGSSLELSADGPIKPPYTVFLQGGLTYESGSVGILSAASEVVKAINFKNKGELQ